MPVNLTQEQRDKISQLRLLDDDNVSRTSTYRSESDLFKTIEHVLRDFDLPESRENLTDDKVDMLRDISKKSAEVLKMLEKVGAAARGQIDASISIEVTGTPFSFLQGEAGISARKGCVEISSLDVLKIVSREADFLARALEPDSKGYLTNVLKRLAHIYPGKVISHVPKSRFNRFLAIILNMEEVAIRGQLEGKFNRGWFEAFKERRFEEEKE